MTMMTSSLVSDSIVDCFVVVYKFAFDYSLFHRKVTVICYIAITLIIGSLYQYFWGQNQYSVFLSQFQV